MSLFGDANYQWRETYFILFRQGDRPMADDVVKALTANDNRLEISDVLSDDDGRLESLTLKSPDDFAAMDISLVTGEEVTEQIDELSHELAKATLSDEDHENLQQLAQCDARFDIFHFEQVLDDVDGGEDEFLDPAALLIVMEKLALICRGVGIDPQSGSLM